VERLQTTSRGVTYLRPSLDEKSEQANIQNFVQQIGGYVATIGTRRARNCVTCGSPADMSTRQTEGLPDLVVFLPPAPHLRSAAGQRAPWVCVWIEVKGRGGTLTPEQVVFREFCTLAHETHIVGGFDAFLEFARAGGWVKF
jgi:hypothetical protein